MVDKQIQHIVNSAIKGDHLPFNRFFQDTYNTLFPKLVALTKSEEIVQEIYLICLQKFWECFVINRQTLPHNSIGYIYIMCKNYWILHQKQGKNTVFFEDVPKEVHEMETKLETDMITPMESLSVSEEQFIKHKALSMALESLSLKCKALMEADLDPKIKLKDLQKTHGYVNYQALVQAKYNCKKRLKKKVFEILRTLQKTPNSKI